MYIKKGAASAPDLVTFVHQQQDATIHFLSTNIIKFCKKNRTLFPNLKKKE
jgi:hypothetical protein